MRRTSTLSTSIVFVLLLVLSVDALGQERRRPTTPMLSNEDVFSPSAPRSVPEETITRTSLSGSPLRNPRALLEGALIKMGDVTSVRTRLQTTLPQGETELLIESVKPDRVHVISPYGEIIGIGRKFYVKSAAGWAVKSEPPGGAQSDLVFDFRALLKEMTSKLSVRITGQVLGSQISDGVETVVYQFGVTDATEAGTILIGVGKVDGFIRRMAIIGASVSVRIWYTNINEKFSIEPPM